MHLTNQGMATTMDPSEAAALNGKFDVMGPEMLEGLQGGIPRGDMAVPAYMQTKTVVQHPEGIDDQFARAAMVMDPNKGDKVQYYGDRNLAEKPPIRAYTGVEGLGQADMLPGMGQADMLPGMGYLANDSLSGPGIGATETGNEVPVATIPVAAPAPAAKPLMGVALIGIALFAAWKMRK